MLVGKQWTTLIHMNTCGQQQKYVVSALRMSIQKM